MSANPLIKKDANTSNQAVKQEWGIYPAEPAARSSIVTPISDQRPTADSGVQQCRYCTETLPSGARECPLCLREVADRSAERRTMISQPLAVSGNKPSTGTSLAAATLTGATGLPVMTQGTAPAAPAGAVYTLESPAQCPECDTEITTIHVIRVMRTQVSFTSTLPRKAYVIACPACRKLLSAGLSGLL
jgi:hypothetical protein